MRKLLLLLMLLFAVGMLAQSTVVVGGGGVPALTDSGTTLTSSEPLLLPDGTTSAPAYSFSGTPGSGLLNNTGASFMSLVTIAGFDMWGKNNVSGTHPAIRWFNGSNEGPRFSSSLTVGWSSSTPDAVASDTGISRIGPKVLAFGNGTGNNTSGFIKTGQTLQVVTSNYTTSATTLAAAGVITGLNFTTPANLASNWSFNCTIMYSQATAAAANLWGVTTAGTAPTNLLVGGTVLTSNAGAQVNGNAIITTATSTTVVTATPSTFGAIGTSGAMFQATIWGTIEAPSNATPSQVGIAVATGNASDALTVYRGSSCWWY